MYSEQLFFSLAVLAENFMSRILCTDLNKLCIIIIFVIFSHTLDSLMLISINWHDEIKTFDPNPAIMKGKSLKQRIFKYKLSNS